MTRVSQIMPDHHKHCDELFVVAEDAAQRADWPAAAAAFARFDAQMRAHFAAEENVLFPAFESATGMTSGPTQMMRYEHEQMRTLLGQLAAAAGARDADGYAGAAETLLMLLQQHNMKEENILYPMCEQAIAQDSASICAQISATLEEEHA